MPKRKQCLITGNIYHVLNRGVGSIPIFKNKRDYLKFLLTLRYYQYPTNQLRLSQFLLRGQDKQKEALFKNKNETPLVEIYAYCLMPNHFHLLVKQTESEGIKEFLRLLCNSYSRHFNVRNKRKGALFQHRFKAIRIETEEQFLHVSRYIHLNPYSAGLVANKQELAEYPFSSLKEYFLNDNKSGICRQDLIWAYFKTTKSFKRFILDQADYQRGLQFIKHQILENPGV